MRCARAICSTLGHCKKITGGISQASRVVARSNNNANANGGVAYANANNAASNANTNYGSRLANIKKIKV